MKLARVIGHVVATRKDPSLAGQRLLLLVPTDHRGKRCGATTVAIDCVGAGSGDWVHWVRGKEASFPFLPRVVPTDAIVTGIIDRDPPDARDSA